GGKFHEKAARKLRSFPFHRPRGQKYLPAAPPVHARWRPLQPHRVAIGDSEGREERGERVANESRVEMLETARSDADERCQHGSEQHAPCCGAERFAMGRAV